MKLNVQNLDGKKAGDIELNDAIFGLEPREDLLQRVVIWQLAKRQRGTHKTLGRAEINRTGKKLYKQKGSGNARHGSARVAQFRGGGRAFGPVVRSHAIDLPKAIRVLGLKHALSSKVKSQSLVVLDDVKVDAIKTKAVADKLAKLGLGKVLIVGGAEVDNNFALSARNIPNVDVLPVQGINVYDILRREKLVLTRAAAEALEARLA